MNEQKNKAGLNSQDSSQQEIICPKCQAASKETANFCRCCGTQLKDNPVILCYK